MKLQAYVRNTCLGHRQGVCVRVCVCNMFIYRKGNTKVKLHEPIGTNFEYVLFNMFPADQNHISGRDLWSPASLRDK